MLEYDLVVNGVTLEGSPANPASCYLLQQVDGLDGRDLREDVAERPGRSGDSTGGQQRAGIRLIVTGVILASSASDLRAKDKALRTALAGGGGFTVTLTGRTGDPADLTETFWVSAPYRAADTVEDPRLMKRFTFSVRSDQDAWRTTGAVNASASTNPDTTRTVTNGGDIPVYPVIVLAATGVATIDYVESTTTGDRFELDGLAGAAGKTFTIDMGAQTIVDEAGASAIHVVNPAAEWLAMLVGSNGFRFHLASGTLVTMVVQWRDRYL